MVTYQWSTEKNRILKQKRGVTFEQAVMHIENGDILDLIDHPNKTRYANQQIIVININEYAHAVPFVQQNEIRFLKTIVPSRKLTKLYLR